jgi:hypothetical protein
VVEQLRLVGEAARAWWSGCAWSERRRGRGGADGEAALPADSVASRRVRGTGRARQEADGGFAATAR